MQIIFDRFHRRGKKLIKQIERHLINVQESNNYCLISIWALQKEISLLMQIIFDRFHRRGKKLIKQIERHLINVQESNNYCRMYGIPLRRNQPLVEVRNEN